MKNIPSFNNHWCMFYNICEAEPKRKIPVTLLRRVCEGSAQGGQSRSTWLKTRFARCKSCRTCPIVDFLLNFTSNKNCRGNKNRSLEVHTIALGTLLHFLLIVKRPHVVPPARCRRGGSRGAEPPLLIKLSKLFLKKRKKKNSVAASQQMFASLFQSSELLV